MPGLASRLDFWTEAVIKFFVLVDGAHPYTNVRLHKLECVLNPIDITATQPFDGTLRLSAQQDDSRLPSRSASVVERLANGFRPMLCPINLDGILGA
jgi:hypothetical protein